MKGCEVGVRLPILGLEPLDHRREAAVILASGLRNPTDYGHHDQPKLGTAVENRPAVGASVSLVPKDLTPVYKQTIGKGAGARRWQRPVYVDHLPPCNHACPAGENIQAWLALAQAGDYEAAWRKYTEENPLPGTHGRACYHPCESACNRQFLDQSVSIHSLDRFLGDLANEKGWTIASGAPTGKRVLVVGAGPAGLSCAYHLRRLGHDVEIRDANPEPGGMKDRLQHVEAGRESVRFFETLPWADRTRVNFANVRGVQFLEPLFEFSGA